MHNPLDILPTRCDLEYADLPIIDLSLCATNEGRCKSVHQVKDALSNVGFFYVVNHGITNEETRRMFEIADVPFSQVGNEEKARHTGNIQEGEIFKGYKARQTWHLANGVKDQIEIYNVNRDVTKQEHPTALRPFLTEISAFAHHTHDVLHQILRLLALGLELPEETLVNLHNFSSEGDTSVRFIKYYPRSEEDELNANNVWLKGHTDASALTILYSQPVGGLQVLSRDRSWKWVKHIENALIINTGDSMEFLSGGLYPSTIHRVAQPPPDQHNMTRMTLLYSCMPDSDVVLAPLLGGPFLQRAGVIDELQGKGHPTVAEWRKARITSYGRTQLSRGDNGVEEEVVLGKIVKHYT